ncbi:MAG: fumarate hydratase C-terminal domain-containing protein, partial [Chloroflexi bacterium]|nr:fumarate hydratase C-terminal domain-containing protein [Chloroflexota bacterium]
RGAQVREALQNHQAVYVLAIGGAGALLAKQIRHVEVVAYEDLGTEAMRRMEVEEFPVIVCNDIHGGDLPAQGKAQWRQADVLER